MKTKVNPDFKFEFETDEELEKAERTGYVPLCDIVRISFYHNEHEVEIDYPVKSRETYIRDLEKLNNDKRWNLAGSSDLLNAAGHLFSPCDIKSC